MLAVVDHQEGGPGCEVGGHLVQRIRRGVGREAECCDEGPGQRSVVGDGRQVDEPDPLRVGGDLPVRHLDGEPGLAAAADPGERHQPVGGDQLADVLDGVVPADERRAGGGERHDGGPGAPQRRELPVAQLAQVHG